MKVGQPQEMLKTQNEKWSTFIGEVSNGVSFTKSILIIGMYDRILRQTRYRLIRPRKDENR